MTEYYRIMAGAKSAYVNECVDGGFIGGDFDIKEDLTLRLPEDWRDFNRTYIPVLRANDPEKSKVAAGLACGMLWTIAKGLNEGDVILTPTGTGSYHVGQVTGPYMYALGTNLPHRRPVKWRSDLIARANMSGDLQASAGSPGTVSKISGFANEIEALLAGPNGPDLIATDPTVEDASVFALEKHLEDFLVANWGSTELGKNYRIYEVDGEQIGRQFPTDTGPIDILAISNDQTQLLVVELKRGRASDPVVGQILRYMGFISEDLAEPNQTVRGIIIALDDDKRIRRALAITPTIDFYKYEVTFKLHKI